MPSGCEEDPQIPQVKSPVRVPQGAPGSLRGGEGTEGTSPNLILESELSFFFFFFNSSRKKI